MVTWEAPVLYTGQVNLMIGKGLPPTYFYIGTTDFMQKIYSILLGAFLVLCHSSVVAFQQEGVVNSHNSGTIFLIRHAEKQTSGRDPELSPQGKIRAQQLARVLSDAQLDKVYSTDFKRTRHTALPVAELYQKNVELYDYRKLTQLAETLKHSGGRYLVVGHSNTTPELVKLLGGDPGDAIAEKLEFDRLYVLTVHPSGLVNTVLLRYGD